MGAEASAYAALGLAPGADRAAIDEAYRRLIKLHHPDRDGGDAERAAEINRAYFELRRKPALGEPTPPEPGDLASAIQARRASRRRVIEPVRRRRRLWPWLLAALAVGLFYERDRATDFALDLNDRITGGWQPAGGTAPVAVQRQVRRDPIDAGLAEREIATAIGEARLLVREAGADRLAAESRECHRELRASPNVENLDRCAAFDYSVALLEERGPIEDEGPFGASAVTARQMAAASLLSNDFLAIEGRLDAIRGRVELALAPPPQTLDGADAAPLAN